MDEVLLRSFNDGGWSLVLQSDQTRALTAADARRILNGRTPAIAWDDSGPGGALRFPPDAPGARLADVLIGQLNAAMDDDACPAESFPEPGCAAAPDVDADVDAPQGWVWARPTVGGYQMARGANAMTPDDVRAILGDEPPCVALNGSGPNGSIFFRAWGEGYQMALSLQTQINAALDAASRTGRDVDAEGDDFAEPVGGEFVRILREEEAHLDALRAEAERSADLLYGRWRPGERFVIGPKSDLPLFYAACHLWAGLIDRTGRVIDRVLIDNGGGYGDHALLVQIDGRTERGVVRVGVMNACAKKVTA